MILSYLWAVLGYHVQNWAYELLLLIFSISIGLALFLAKRNSPKPRHWVWYLRIDFILLIVCNISGSMMLHLTQQDERFLWVSMLFFLLGLLFLSENLAAIFIMSVLVVVTSFGLQTYLQQFGMDLFLVYCLLRCLAIFVYGGLFSDLLLFVFRKHLSEIPPDPEEEEEMDEQTRRREAISRQKAFRSQGYLVKMSAVFMAGFLLFVAPSNLHYVNAEACQYQDLLRLAAGFISEHAPEPTAPQEETAPESSGLTLVTLNKADLINEEQDYLLDFLPDTLNQYSVMDLNCHQFSTVMLTNVNVQNPILQQTVDMTQEYTINPSYLFVQLMHFNGANSRAVAAPTGDTLPVSIDMSEIAPIGVSTDTYMHAAFDRLMHSYSAVPDALQDFGSSSDSSGTYYTYFAFCDESCVYYVTLYLYPNEEGEIGQADYSVFQFIDLSGEGETVSFYDYPSELQKIFEEAFPNISRQNIETYDTLLQEGNSYACLRKYYGTFVLAD